MDLTIEQSCPGCGADIELHEDDRMVRCPFCEVDNYMLEQGARRFVLPWSLPLAIDESDLFFVPYLRFKGAIYYTTGEKVKYRLVDATRLGIGNDRLPASLRLRPQAMKVKPVVADMTGRFLPQTVKTEIVFSHATRITTLFAKEKEGNIYNRAFIGESISRIYQPYYIHQEQLFDAVDNNPLGEFSSYRIDQRSGLAAKTSWEPRFISTVCPQCADLLQGERDSLALSCNNCETMWVEQGDRFVPLQWSLVKSERRGARYLPFWKISLSSPDKNLETLGAFLRLTNQPVLVRREYDDIPFSFWIPAFKVNPRTLLQLAEKLTVIQSRIPEGTTGRLDNNYPVTLPLKEAVQSIKSVLAGAALYKKRVYPMLPKIDTSPGVTSLVYLPFSGNSHDLTQEHTMVTVNAAALKFGRKL
ncbi:MAG: hypothetical protein JRC87_07150 [Deltaproteobacteria bacterium]|nr:hypothetical protein [Deltaproteobacteria bacterium]